MRGKTGGNTLIPMITLKNFKPRIVAFIDAGLARFTSEHPTENPTTIGIYSCPWSGWVSLCINVGDTDDTHKRNCPDFKFVGYAIVQLPEWEEEYFSDAQEVQVSESHIVSPSADEGDEGYNKPFFDFLTEIAKEYFKDGRVRTTWVGVQMLDSALVKFWKL